MALIFVDYNLTKDKEIVSAAVKENAEALHYADKSLLKDKPFIEELIKINPKVKDVLESMKKE